VTSHLIQLLLIRRQFDGNQRRDELDLRREVDPCNPILFGRYHHRNGTGSISSVRVTREETRSDVPFFSKTSNSSKKAGTCTTTPEPMNAVQLGLTKPM
jgi:hypothetical protein